MNRLVRLYPAAWRERYEVEFLALVEQRPPTVLERVDVIRGGIDARLHPQVQTRREAGTPIPPSDDDVRLSRRLGLGALGGTVLWVTALAFAATGPVVYDGDGAYRDGAAGAPFLLGAVVLFTGGLIGQLVRMPRSAWLARAGAGVAIPFTLLWGLAPWLIWAAVPMIGGLLALAVGGYRSRAWTAWTTISVVLGCLTVVGVVAYGVSTSIDRMGGAWLFMAAATAFVPSWLAVGVSLVRRPI